MKNEIIERDGLRFRVVHEHDGDAQPPWTDDGHGPVRHTYTRDNAHSAKRAGELRLTHTGWLYDFQEACKIALRDSWNSCTNREEAAQAARDDFDSLRSWCNDEWSYIGVVVTLIDVEGNDTDAVQSLWRVDDNGSYADEVAQELAAQCVHDVSAMLYGDDGSIYMSGSRSWRVK